MPELTSRRRLLILAICCMSLLIVGLDNTIVNIALPDMRRDLGASVSGLQWTIDSYTLVLASLLLLSGSTADRVGRRRIFQTGLLLFSLGSLLCSVAPSLGLLIVFRMLQAVGGSMLNPVAMSIITNVFTDPRERARAIGVWGGVVGLSMALGPVVGGALVQSVGWRSIFWVNVPVGIAAIFLTAAFVPESRAPHPRRFDPIGQLLVIGLLASLTYGIIEGPNNGWRAGETVSSFAISLICLVGLLYYESRRAEPLIDLRFFRSTPFSGAIVIAVCGFASLGGFLFANTLYLQDVRGLDPLQAGLYTLPMALMMLVIAPASGRIVGRRGPRLPLICAGIGFIAAALVLTRITTDMPVGWLFAAYLLFGLGFGMVNAPITNTAVAGMPRSQAGVAAAVASTSRQIGQSLGVAVIGAVIAGNLHGAIGAGYARATRPAWWILFGCGVAILVLGIATTSVRARRSANQVAEHVMHDEDLQPVPS